MTTTWVTDTEVVTHLRVTTKALRALLDRKSVV